MAEQEAQWEDVTAGEAGLVTSARRQVEPLGLLPAADLQAIVRRRFRVRRQGFAHVVPIAEAVADREKVEAGEVDRVEAKRVDAPDCVRQGNAGPRAFTKLVGVVMNEPIGVQLSRELSFTEQNPLPLEAVRSVVYGRGREAFDGEDAAAHIRLHGRNRAVSRAVVEKVNLDALIDEVADDVADDVGFVVRGDNCDD